MNKNKNELSMEKKSLKKADYDLVIPINDDDDEVDEVFDDETGFTQEDCLQTSPLHSKQSQCWTERFHKTLIPDDKCELLGIRIVEGSFTIKFLKFIFLTALGITSVHWTVRWLDWERDVNYTMNELMVYEGNLILLDMLFFFVVGRLYEQRGVDHLAWLVTVLAGSFYASVLSNFQFLQHSVSLYEIHCKWPWQLFIFVIIVVPLCITLAIKHVQYAIQNKLIAMKLIEIGFTVLFFLVPVMGNPFFHFHHWFAGWLLGMHCNFNVWWSRAAMAWCWGQYINGIAVYGRDPTLTCAYAFFVSTSDGACSYLSCFFEHYNQQHNQTGSNHTTVSQPHLEAPDWWTCTIPADSNAP